MDRNLHHDFEGLVQDCSNSSALANKNTIPCPLPNEEKIWGVY